MNEVQSFTTQAIDFAWKVLPDLLLAIAVLLVGFWVIKLIAKAVSRAMERAKMEESLRRFLISLISVGLKIMLLISVASMVGIATTSFVAVIGAAGLAVGLALQGSLANFAGGVLILMFKPFKVGDVVDVEGFVARVHEIQIFNTILKSPDNKTIIIPNGKLSNNNIVNFSVEPTRRVDMTFGIGYGDDISRAKNLLMDIVKNDPRVLSDPEPMVALSELADSSVNLVVRAWVNSADYWGLYFDMQEKVKTEFDAHNISFPFPQRDLHLFQEK